MPLLKHLTMCYTETWVAQETPYILNNLNINHDSRIVECKGNPNKCVVMMKNP
jgi:hypothetical protein